MSLYIQGIGWISPAARGITHLTAALQTEPLKGNFPCLTLEIRYEPRLRRSGRISQLALAAVLDALADAGKEWTAKEADRTALIFLSTHGSLCHTIRFFETVATHGASSGSPIFFPETVYNAPSSHIAAHLGIDGMVTSLVGDSSAVGAAFCTAEEWMEAGICDQCIVVAAEEIAPLLQKAYHSLRLGPRRFGGSPFSEAAAAVFLSPNPKGSAIHPHPGTVIRKNSHLVPTLCSLFKEATGDKIPKLILTSALGTQFKMAEHAAINELWPGVTSLFPKSQLGESFTASGLGNVVIGESLTRIQGIAPILI